MSYLVVGDRFLRSQWTASKKAAFQNRRLCLQGGRCWGRPRPTTLSLSPSPPRTKLTHVPGARRCCKEGA